MALEPSRMDSIRRPVSAERPEMKPSTSQPGGGVHPDFSLIEGGLLFPFLRWAHLSDDALRGLRLRVIVIALTAWLPLLVLSALEGRMLGVSVPFLLDVEAHVRFLVALPLLLIAELEAHLRLTPLLRQFLERRLIPENAIPRFEAVVTSTLRLRRAVLPEVLILVFVYGVGVLIIWRHVLVLDTDTWYLSASAEGSKLTLAGIWYGYVSLPIVQFLLLRWYWQLFVWARLLWQVSRIKLSLLPAHPDRAGGLGFLADTGYSFAMLAAALGALAAGHIASRIFFAGARLSEFADEIVVLVAFVLCVIFGPLLFFAQQLAVAKLVGRRQYGMLGERYVRTFDDKWLDGRGEDESLVGSADIQSLADLSNSYAVVESMRFAPITKQAILGAVAATLVPIAPLLLTIIPLNELVQKLLGIVF
jgi:hypothetical protein